MGQTGDGSRLDRELVANILADGFLLGFRTAADKHGRSERTLRRWRAYMEGDEGLACAVREKVKRGELDWRRTRVRFLVSATAKLNELVQQAGVGDIRAVAGAIHIVGNLDVAVGALINGLATADHSEGRATPPPPRPDGAGADSEHPTPLH